MSKSSFQWQPATAYAATIGGMALALVVCLAAPAYAADPAQVTFPSLDSSYLHTGDFVGPDHTRRVRPGLNKDQVRLQLGNPHFSEGIFSVREWDYAFNFYTGQGDKYVTCQFKTRFDENDVVTSTHWADQACEQIANPPALVAAAPAPATATAGQRVTLAADGLFVFGRSGLADLLPGGREKLTAMAAGIRAGSVKPSAVTVTGHTDRIGSNEENLMLSRARAATVRDYMTQNGVAPELIRSSGVGESQPVKDCAGERITPALIQCLQPNRRVEIEVTGRDAAR